MSETTQPIILIVDDNARLLRGIERMLSEHFTIITVVSAAEAMAVIEREPVDVVLADNQMPGLQGTALLGLVARTHPGIARILMTGDAGAVMKQQASRAEVVRVLEKPFHGAKVVAAICDALAMVSDAKHEIEVN
ncbi:MAG: response regulator [Planctomycetales bacterium]|nr:response regulator [Planctomycetales bacterium]